MSRSLAFPALAMTALTLGLLAWLRVPEHDALSWWKQRHERLLELVAESAGKKGRLHAERAAELLLERRVRPELDKLLADLSGEDASAWKTASEAGETLLQQIWATRWERGHQK